MTITIVIAAVNSGFSQTYTTGHEDMKADVNFTELANYINAHPEPLYRKPLFIEDEDEEMPEQPEADPSMVHLIHRNAARFVPGFTPAAMIASPAPADTFQALLSDGTGIPPDTHGAVDSTYCVTAINTGFRIQTRTGGSVSGMTLDAFWTSVLPHGGGSFDPRVHYDPNYKRWIMVCDAYGQSANSQIMVAVSATSNPTGTWHMYSVVVDPTGVNWLDYPCVGFNGKWITVTGNLFKNSGGGGSGAVVYVFNYASIMAGTGAPYTKISESSYFTLCPAQTYDVNEQNMFMVTINNPGSGKIQLLKISGPVGAPVITSVGYPATTQHWHSGGGSDFAPQLGTTNKVQAGDGRIFSAVQVNNYVWCTHTVFLPSPGTANRCSIMWWQVDTLASPRQNGIIDDPTTPSFYDYPSIAVNRNNDVLVGFSALSANTYPSAAYALHMHTDPNDSMRKLSIFRHGKKNYYQTFGGSQNRWGDYSATCVDPRNNNDFWTIQESVPVSPPNRWDTWWAHVTVCPASASYTKAQDSTVKGKYDTLTFNGFAPTTSIVTWSFSGGTAVPGTGTGPQSVKWTTGGWKVVTITVTDTGCSSTYTDSIYVGSNVGLNEPIVSATDFEIVPNPNEGAFNIVSNKPLNGFTGVKIIDMQGRVVYSRQSYATNSNAIPVNTPNLPNGLYVISINVDGASVTKKITIER